MLAQCARARAAVRSAGATAARRAAPAPSCRYAAAGQHPDLRIVEPVEIDDDEPKAVEWIVVDRIRALTRWAS